MREEREIERHQKILEQINNANVMEELPSVSLPVISSYLAKNMYFDNEYLSQTLFKPVVDLIVKYNTFDNEQVKEQVFKVLRENYPNHTEEEFLEKYNQIVSSPRIDNLLIEIAEKNKKIRLIQDKIDLENHEQIMSEIRNANDVKELPKVGLTELNVKIRRSFNNSYIKDIKISSLKNITDAYLEEKELSEIEQLVLSFCNKQDLTEEEKKNMFDEIYSSLKADKSIRYTVEEMKYKEERKLELYELEHEYTMQNIKDATRISQLPPNLTSSYLAKYLSGNSTIFPKEDKISSTDLKELTDLLLSGKKMGR